VQNINRFARYWDLIGNSGRFSDTLKLILREQPFTNFSVISSGVFTRTGQTHKISLLRLYDLVFNIASEDLDIDPVSLRSAIQNDHSKSGLKSFPKCLIGADTKLKARATKISEKNRHNSRQARH
jgi:hypothetical protein